MTSNGMTRAVGEPTAASTGPRSDDERHSNAQQLDAAPESKPDTVETASESEPSPTTDAAAVKEATPAEATAAPEVAAALEAQPTLSEAAPEPAPTPSSDPATEPAPVIAEKAATSEASAPPPAVSVPPAPLESRAAPYSTAVPAVEVSEEWRPRTTFWNTRPNRTWMLVGGSAVVIAFLLGTVTGRVTGPERSAEYIAPASPAAVPAATTEPAVVTAGPAVPSSAPPDEANASRPAGASPKISPKSVTNEAPSGKQVLPAFNAKAAKAAIDGVSPRLKACKHAGDPVGPASVMVTFAPAGRVSNAAITTTGYTGTRTGNCVIARLRELRIPEFTGAAVTVKRSVTVR